METVYNILNENTLDVKKCEVNFANHLLGVQVMATISLQCNSRSQIHSSVYFRLKIVEHTYIGEVLIQVY